MPQRYKATMHRNPEQNVGFKSFKSKLRFGELGFKNTNVFIDELGCTRLGFKVA